MTSARGANKAQAVGTRQGSVDRDRGNRKKELNGFQRQLAERLDLLARFRAKLSPPETENVVVSAESCPPPSQEGEDRQDLLGSIRWQWYSGDDDGADAEDLNDEWEPKTP